MSATCSQGSCCGAALQPAHNSPRYRRVLWAALVINALMFGVEIVAGWASGSVALLADAVDFFGDAANYGVSLFVLGMAPVWRSRAALVKALSMGAFGVFVLGRTAWGAANGEPPQAWTMGVVGLLALVANASVALMLYAWREGDANMRSVWLCSRNDALGNLAVVAAALGVFGTGQAWPDLAVAGVMGGLALAGAASVLRQARAELRAQSAGAAAGTAPGAAPGAAPGTAPSAVGGVAPEPAGRTAGYAAAPGAQAARALR